MADRAAELEAGRIGRPHGLQGSFYVTRPRARLLTVGAQVTVAGRTVAITRRAGTEARPIIALEGIGDRPAAEALRGETLLVGTNEAPMLAEGEWWAHELEGCEVVDGDRPVGRVIGLIELPSCEALEVEPPEGGGPLLVPMVKDAIRHVEPDRRRIEVDLEFLDVPDAPPRRRPAPRRRPPSRSGEGS